MRTSSSHKEQHSAVPFGRYILREREREGLGITPSKLNTSHIFGFLLNFMSFINPSTRPPIHDCDAEGGALLNLNVGSEANTQPEVGNIYGFSLGSHPLYGEPPAIQGGSPTAYGVAHPLASVVGAGHNTQFADYRAAGRFSAPRAETLLLVPPRHP
jgi:hypothetical protein